ncbi:MAG TPA: SDR family NAD(P)-dependent oxidoreductase [Burkholderiales bacterium]|nr:SDR family NAD(P)-dependent oxidoreductase [Burkholderiales bacterium]
MHLDLTGRSALVAGGSRGIGRSIALVFAKAGANVSICARGESALRETEGELRRIGHKVHALTCDLSDGDAVKRYVQAAAEALGGIDVLVNNASAFAGSDDEAGWAASINVDLLAPVRASRAALPYLEKSRAGSIIHISSIAGLQQSARHAPYGAAKAALVQYTLTQAAQLAAKKIRVNCIAPGSIEFPGGVWDRRKTRDPELYNATLRSVPFGRLGTPEEIAKVALFLASDAAGWVTGQTIAVDGGQTLF